MDILKKIANKVDGLSVVESQGFDLGFVDTGSYAYNKIISGKFKGGYPIGSVIEIAGESSTAKTVFAIEALINAQKKDYYTVFIDNEQAFTPEFAQKLGLDLDKCFYASPETMEDCFDVAEKAVDAIRSEDPDTPIVVAYDSIGASPARKEMEGDVGSNAEITGALRAKVAGQCLRRINQMVRPKKVLFLVINQLRGTLAMYGPKSSKAGGGRSLKYYCAAQVLSKSGKNDIVEDELKNAIGIKGRLEIEKNKITVPFQNCEFFFNFTEGLDCYEGLLEVLLKSRKVVSPSKGWYALPGSEEKKFRKSEIGEIIKANPELLEN